MSTEQEILALEHTFWQSMVDQDVTTALTMIDGDSAVVGAGGIVRFDAEGYRRMAEDQPAWLRAFEISDAKVIFPIADVAISTYRVQVHVTASGEPQQFTAYDSTTWVRRNGRWVATLHTEAPAREQGASG